MPRLISAILWDMTAEQQNVPVYEPYPHRDEWELYPPSPYVTVKGRKGLKLHDFARSAPYDPAYWEEALHRTWRATQVMAVGSVAASAVFAGVNVVTFLNESEVEPALYSVGNADCSTSNLTVLHMPPTGKNVSQHLEYHNRKFIEDNGGASWNLWYGTKWDPDKIHKMIDDKAKECNRKEKIALYISTMSLGGKLAQQIINKGEFKHAEVRGLIMSASAPSADEVSKFEAQVGVRLAASLDAPLPLLGRPFVWASATQTEIQRNGLWNTLTNQGAHKAISDSTAETHPGITGWQMIENGRPVAVEYIPQAGTAREMRYYFIGSKHDKVVDDEQAFRKWQQLTGKPVQDFWIEKEQGVIDSDNHADDWVASRRDPQRQTPRYDTNEDLNYNEAYALIYRKEAVRLAWERDLKKPRSPDGRPIV